MNRLSTRIAHFCTFPHGGAAAAAKRHHHSLLDAHVDSHFYFHRNQKNVAVDETYSQVQFDSVRHGWLTGAVTRRLEKRRQRRIYDLFNRFLAVRPESAETFSMAELPEPTPLNWQQVDADIVHLHWIAYFADYPSFFGSIPASTPIVWSLHDTNAFTGGCHYHSGCQQFKHGCGDCPQLVNRTHQDVSRVSMDAKRRALAGRSIHVVAPCDWMIDAAQDSNVWPEQTSFSKIEYGLDLKNQYPAFTTADQRSARETLGLDADIPLVAFGAMDVENPRKGFQHLVSALADLQQRGLQFECLVFGEGRLAATNRHSEFPKLHSLGYVESMEIKRSIYLAADVVVVPSIEDNQPQVGLESMACGTPVVAFNASGMPEYVIDQETGLLAETGNESELAACIESLLRNREFGKLLGENARGMIETRFERLRQREKWMSLYSDCLGSRRQRRAA
ncbi:MAG: glycosyltransferase [Planctomycetota bacterium]